MYEIFKNPNVNWLGLKRPFIIFSIALLVPGTLSVYWRGFNLSIDFAGGTLVGVKFKGTRPPENQIRDALAKQGMDKDKVIIQPISDPTTGRKNQVLIRLPLRQDLNPSAGSTSLRGQVLAAPVQATAQTQRATTSTSTPASPQTQSGIPAASQPAGTASTAEAPAGQSATPTTAPSSQPPSGAGAQLGAEKATILRALKSFDDPADVTNKTDLNTVGRDGLRDKLVETDPLGIVAASGQTAATADYSRYAELIVQYREEQGGLINQVSDLRNVSGLPQRLVETLPSKFYAGNAIMTSAEVVGPQIGEELRERAIYVVLASFVGILIFIAFRFEWIYGVAAVIAVFHDLLVTLGIFSLLRQEISLNVVAALLTLAGYSVNDTIVVFDRIRENLRLRRREDLTIIVNDSINQTLSRTVLTSGLTFLTVFCLWVFGGPVLSGFAFALVIGIIVGTYSSIAIASPLMVWWKQWQELRARARRRIEAGRRGQDVKRKVAAS